LAILESSNLLLGKVYFKHNTKPVYGLLVLWYGFCGWMCQCYTFGCQKKM